MPARVAAFTDTYLPTVNGVTYTVRSWRDRWTRRGGRMDLVVPGAPGYDPDSQEHAVGSVPFPWYDGCRVGTPRVPRAVANADVDLVHAHTPFSLGLAARRLARRMDRPLVASYHTPTAGYVPYLTATRPLVGVVERAATAYERWFYGQVDLIITPSETARDEIRDRLAVTAPIQVIPNGVDTERFRPVDPTPFRDRYDLESDRPHIGYTGRHGHEKRLEDLLGAVARLERDDATLVFGGDGPARPALKRRVADLDVDARFLGVLDRNELPALYAALDVFAFPSPVETYGLVGLEAIACGTPVAAADAGALSETVTDGETGLHYPPGDVDALARALETILADRAAFEDRCLERRSSFDVARSIDRLERAYASLSE
jgi:1,2-diacylglycerol 3-alpha-glucosyltransferase